MLFKKKQTLTTEEKVDLIEKTVFEELLKEKGFRKAARVLFRLVDGDMFHIVSFQTSNPAKTPKSCLWVNLGVRVPESVDRTFERGEETEKFYYDYQCNIRTRLSILANGKDTPYELDEMKPQKIAEDIILNMSKFALPMFEDLKDRDGVLLNRIKFEKVEYHANVAELEAAMIYGRMGDKESAAKLFNNYYISCLERKEADLAKPQGEFLIKETVASGVTAHTAYLIELAEKLGIEINANA